MNNNNNQFLRLGRSHTKMRIAANAGITRVVSIYSVDWALTSPGDRVYVGATGRGYTATLWSVVPSSNHFEQRSIMYYRGLHLARLRQASDLDPLRGKLIGYFDEPGRANAEALVGLCDLLPDELAGLLHGGGRGQALPRL